MPENDIKAIYYGCWRGPGHFFRATGGHQIWESDLPADLPWRYPYRLCVGSRILRRPDGRGGTREDIETPVEQPEGVAQIFRKDGWTALAFWDRSEDRRGGCCSAFYLRGELTFDEARDRAQHAFPSVWARYPFKVRMHALDATYEASIIESLRAEIQILKARLTEAGLTP